VTNQGTHHHDFLIMHPEQTQMLTMDQVYSQALTYLYNIAPGQTKTLTYTFHHTAPSGLLQFACHYGGHYEAGMWQPIVIVSPPGQAVAPYPNNAIPAAAQQGSADAKGPCDPAVTVSLVNDAYDPTSVKLNKGDTLLIQNKTTNSFTLTTTPNAGIPFTVVDPGELQPVPFPDAGTFTVSSQEHPQAKLMVQVAATAGLTCGYTPVATVSFDANYTNASASQYFFIPTTVTITEGQSITLSNLSDQDLTFTSQPDAGLGNVKIDKNEHQTLFFANNGTYVITCTQFPNEHVTIVVKDNGNGMNS
jgi:plastocyanin